MKILLVACNAKYIHSNLAIYDLRAFAVEYQRQIVLKEYTINQAKDEILGDIYREEPDMVCMSCYIWNISYVTDLLEDLAKILPRTALWVGGPEVSYHAVQFLEGNPWLKGVMRGEGEEIFRELAAFYSGDIGSLEEISGITYRENNEVLENPWREPMELDMLPFPYKDMGIFEHRILYYESSRGCPFSCSYCLSSIDKKLRFRSLELVKKELQFFLDQKVPQVKFVDRTFNCKASHTMEVWRYLLEHDNGVTNFHFEVAADLINEEELELISRMRPGLIQLEIGVQSTNPDTIKAIHRVMDFEKVKEMVMRIRAMGRVHQHLDLIAGLPYEDYESFHQSFLDVYALRPDQLQLGFLKVLKGSYMYDHAAEYGCCYRSKEPYEVLSTKWLSYDELLKLKMVESMVEVYYNSGQFPNTMEAILPFFEDAFVMYESLGSFYRKKGYDTLSHSRLRRYDILLEFFQETDTGMDMEVLRETMLMDLYLRENIKSRPSWAPDCREYLGAARNYIKNNRLPKTAHIEVFSQRTLLFDYENRDPLFHNAAVQEIHL